MIKGIPLLKEYIQSVSMMYSSTSGFSDFQLSRNSLHRIILNILVHNACLCLRPDFLCPEKLFPWRLVILVLLLLLQFKMQLVLVVMKIIWNMVLQIWIMQRQKIKKNFYWTGPKKALDTRVESNLQKSMLVPVNYDDPVKQVKFTAVSEDNSMGETCDPFNCPLCYFSLF